MTGGLKERFLEIDSLRGIAIFVMILIHTSVYFLRDRLAFFLWDASQFAVPAFIFCSTYIFLKKDYKISRWRDFFQYFKKRAWRLIFPYYLFLLSFLFFVYLKQPDKITLSYLLANLFVVGGVDINWLVLLFLMFAVLMPLVSVLGQIKKTYFYLFSLVSLVSSFVLIFFHPQINYKAVMWLPWSLIIVFSWYFIRHENSRKFLWLSAFLSFLVFVFLRILEAHINHPLDMYDNKYPPNLYHLSYGISIFVFLYALAREGFLRILPLKLFLNFLSRNSYSIFFIHYLVIYVVANFFSLKFNWLSFFLTVLAATILVQKLLLWIKQFTSFAKLSTTE